MFDTGDLSEPAEKLSGVRESPGFEKSAGTSSFVLRVIAQQRKARDVGEEAEMRRGLFIVGLGFVLAASNASAQDGTDAADAADAADGLDVTMTLMSAGDELPDVITALIELPKDDAGDYIPSENAVAHSARGHETANAAREDGRAFGEAMAAAARENREDAARGGRPDLSELRPDNVPELPNVPNLPDQAGPPELPVTPPGPPGQG